MIIGIDGQKLLILVALLAVLFSYAVEYHAERGLSTFSDAGIQHFSRGFGNRKAG